MLQSKPQEESAPAEAQPRADMAFVLSAPEATLAPDKLTLTGVSSTAQFITDEKKSGVVRTGVQPWHWLYSCHAPQTTLLSAKIVSLTLS